MIISSTDLAFMKGEAAAEAETDPSLVFALALQDGYGVADDRRAAFVLGFMQSLAAKLPSKQ